MAIDVQKLWNISEAPNTVTIPVKRVCGHVERFPFEGIEQPGGYSMPKSEADRLAVLRLTVCVMCDNDRD